MKRFKGLVRKDVVTGLALAMLTAGTLGLGALPAVAADQGGSNDLVTTVTGGNRTASISSGGSLSFGSIESSFDGGKTEYAYGTLTVTDKSATGAGWIVTAIASDLAYLGDNPGGEAIPAFNVTVARGNPPERVDGMEIDVTGGPNALTSYKRLDEEVTLLEAESGFGMGQYSLELEFDVSPPAYARAGDYKGTLTITIAPNLPPG